MLRWTFILVPVTLYLYMIYVLHTHQYIDLNNIGSQLLVMPGLMLFVLLEDISGRWTPSRMKWRKTRG